MMRRDALNKDDRPEDCVSTMDSPFDVVLELELWT
jgi:hypothetical protein